MMRIEGLSKDFDGQTIIDGLDLHVGKGSIYGMVGVNGAGKTTLIKMIADIIQPDRGKILLDGEPVSGQTGIKARIGYVPDELYFYTAYTLRQMARFISRLYPDWDESYYREQVDYFGLDENRKLNRFSKGMRRQAAIILTLSQRPDFLLLDEPIDGLDPFVRKKVWRRVMEDIAEREISVLVSSHNLRELEGVCDTIGIINRGRMLLERDLSEMKSEVSKIQVAFRKGMPDELEQQLEILYRELRGSVQLMVVRGNQAAIMAAITPYDPMVLDILPLSLEELFIYELGGDGFDIDEILF